MRTHLRDALIVPEMIGSVIGVYNGKTFNQVRLLLLKSTAACIKFKGVDAMNAVSQCRPALRSAVCTMLTVSTARRPVQVEIKPDMVGTYLAEYSISYKPVKHGACDRCRFIPWASCHAAGRLHLHDTCCLQSRCMAPPLQPPVHPLSCTLALEQNTHDVFSRCAA